jgi:hypothetical protein
VLTIEIQLTPDGITTRATHGGDLIALHFIELHEGDTVTFVQQELIAAFNKVVRAPVVVDAIEGR